MEEGSVQEQIQAGIHFGELNSLLSSAQSTTVLRGIARARLAQFLRRPGQGLVAIIIQASPTESTGGLYTPLERTITLNTARKPHTYGQIFVPGQTWALSYGGSTREYALQRSLVHELGHHLIEMGGPEVHDLIRQVAHAGKPISRRAQANWQEYFCESYSAYTYHRSALLAHDPVGYTVVQDVLKRLGVLP